MKGKRRSVLLAIALVIALPAVALAALATVTITDSPTDSPGKFEIATVNVDKTGDNMLRHVVVMAQSFTPTDLLVPSGPRPAICVLIWTKRKPGEARPDYQLCAHATEDGRKLRGTLARLPESGLPRRVSVIEADRPDDRSVALEVTASDLGKPKSYRFSAQVQGPAGPTSATCPKFTGCVDYAPDRRSFGTFKP